MSGNGNKQMHITETEQMILLQSAASIYVSMHVLDLKEDTVLALSCAEHLEQFVKGRTTHVREVLSDVFHHVVEESYLEMVLKFVDFETLDERMQGVKTITMEFAGRFVGWCRARFIAVDYDEEGKLHRVLFTVENIDAERKQTNRLLYLSEIDQMTKIRNRGSGEKMVRDLLLDHAEGTFFLLDVDKFKSFNDEFGHQVGDQVLIAIAKAMQESFREVDVLMRLGGDEFAVFALGVNTEAAAVAMIERFFESVDRICIPEIGDRKIYVSLGAAVKKAEDEEDFESLYRLADKGTYESKKVFGNTYTFSTK